MADSIGSLALTITATTKSFDDAINGAQKKLSDFAKLAATPLKGVSALTGGLDSILGPLASGVGRIPLLGGLAGSFSSSSAIVSTVKETTLSILAQKREADRLGVSMKQMVGYQIAAGPASEVLDHAMAHLSRELGAVAVGSDEANKKFRALGLNGKALAAGSFDTSIKTIADQIKAMPTAVERANAAFKLFGKQGFELLPFLEKGGSGIAAAQEKGLLAGLIPSPTEIANLKRASEALRDIDRSIEAIKRQASIKSAQTIQDFEGLISGQPGSLDKLQKNIFRNLNAGISGAAGDWWREGVLGSQPQLKRFGASDEYLKFYDARRRILSSGISFDAPENAKDRGILKEYYAKQKELQDAANKPNDPALQAIQQQTELRAEAEDLAMAIERQAEAMGKGAHAADILKLATRGLNAEDLDLLANQAKLAEIAGNAEEFKKQSRGPLGDFEDQRTKIEEAFKAGKIDDNTRALALARAFGRLDSPVSERLSPAITDGSAQALSVISQAGAQQGAPDVVAALRQANQLQQQAIDTAKDILRQLQGAGVLLPANLGGGGP